jgi:hypothetical protein
MRGLAVIALLVGACRAHAPAPKRAPIVETTHVEAPSPATAPVEESGETAEARALRLEREDYAMAIETAVQAGRTCRADPIAIDVDALVDAYGILAPYEQSPERDGAIQTLEMCRKLAIGHVQAALPAPEGTRRTDAANVRRAVEEKGKRATKPLRFVVKGKHVTVEEKRNPERAPRAPKTLQGHCAMSDPPPGDPTDLAEAEEGEVGCSNAFRFSQQSDYVVQRVGLSRPFVVESTEKRKTPVK